MLRLGGYGDNWHMTWTADDSQLVALCDGFGFPNGERRPFNSRLYRLVGNPPEARFLSVSGYPDINPGAGMARYYGFGTIALDHCIYQFMSTFSDPISPGAVPPTLRFVGVKLIYSLDNGKTFHNQDGSTPVVWEPFEQQSTETMVFFHESQEAFQLPSVLQMGRNYSDNEDGFVYVYSPNGNTEGTMNELVMFRVATDCILNRKSYEYFAGLKNGRAIWTRAIEGRAVVHTFPPGWVSSQLHPYSWQPSVVYNAPLGIYLMTSWGMGCAADGMWFAKPSYLGFWASEHPWGPWEQIHEETAWTPGGDRRACAYQPQIAPKWIADDGKAFWLVWSDFQAIVDQQDIMSELQRTTAAATSTDELIARRVALQPNYGFNAQRVDLLVR